MPRHARLDAAGTLHHVIIRGIERRRIVDDDQDRSEFVSRLGKLASETGTSIYAWALMTNHAHILLSSGPAGLAKFMRRFLTGYAVSYNLRHRHGHLFQNRYRSIICDGDRYFAELVRYIHLNPLRVKLVADLKELEKYPYCGHGVILGETGHLADLPNRKKKGSRASIASAEKPNVRYCSPTASLLAVRVERLVRPACFVLTPQPIPAKSRKPHITLTPRPFARRTVRRYTQAEPKMHQYFDPRLLRGIGLKVYHHFNRPPAPRVLVGREPGVSSSGHLGRKSRAPAA